MDGLHDHHQSSYQRIVEAANAVFLDGGVMPISLSDVAERANVSRSLIYSHFPSQHDLMNGVLNYHLPILERICEAARSGNSDRSVLLSSAMIYFDAMTDAGPTLALAPNDAFLTGHVTDKFKYTAITCLRTLARAAQRIFKVSPGEAVAGIVMLKSLPDEAALLAWSGQIDIETCRNTLEETLDRAISSMTFHEDVYPS